MVNSENEKLNFTAFIPHRIIDVDGPMSLLAQNILFGRWIVMNGKTVLATALYEPDRASFIVKVEAEKNLVHIFMDYYNQDDRRAKVVMGVHLSKDGTRNYEAKKYFEGKEVGSAYGGDDWSIFFTHVALIKFVNGEKFQYDK